MGFELLYDFHEKLETGGFDLVNTKSKKKKIGDPFEDVPLSVVAAEIIKLRARRDVFVTSFKVYELAKKEVAFKETKGGIVIKNKKFLIDEETDLAKNLKEVDIDEGVPAAPNAIQPHNVIRPRNTAMEPATPQARPTKAIRNMVYAPLPQMIPEIQMRGWKFTMDKKYPVYKITNGPIGEIYKMIDDSGKEVTIDDKYFVPETNLYGDKELGFTKPQASKDIDLWGGMGMEDAAPVILRK